MLSPDTLQKLFDVSWAPWDGEKFINSQCESLTVAEVAITWEYPKAATLDPGQALA